MRFGMYLPIWTDRADQEAEVRGRANRRSREGDEVNALLQQGMDHALQELGNRNRLAGLWQKNDFAARTAWDKVRALSKADRDRVAALSSRQQMLAHSLASGALLRFDAQATAPFTTGLGNEHPLENGFAFLNPYGLPCLPGSGVKGVLRQAARELADGEWGDTHGWRDGQLYPLLTGPDDARKPVRDRNGQPVVLSMADVLFGRETADGDSVHVRGSLSFWDVIPQIAGDALHVEIMTPHQSHYYQQKQDRKSGDSVTPHDSGQPVPIAFLTVPPGSGFTFHVVCDLAHLQRLAPELAALDPVAQKPRWQGLITAAFEHAFAWLGFGAKTAVGYGAMETEGQRQTRQRAAQERANQERQQAKRQEEARQQAEAVQWPGARLKFSRANKSLTAEKDGKSAIALAPKGEELLATLPADVRRKVEANVFVRVTAYVADGVLVRVEP
jgi:CRISPR-associated protein Cmr6